MMNFLRIAAFAAALTPSLAFGQAAQIGPGQVWGNATAAQRNGKSETITAIFDRALGSTRGAIIERGASGWQIVTPSSTSGLAWVSQGTGADPIYGVVALAGGGCGAALTASNGGIVWTNATTCAILAGIANAGRPLLSGSTAAPTWAVFSLPGSVTSGGLAYFSSTSAMASSALLAANAIMLGGGAGGAPSTLGSLGTITTVLHGNAAGAPSFGAVVSSDLNITTTSCTNQLVSAISATASGTCSSVTYAMMATAAIATSAELQAGTASKLLSAAIIFDGEVTVTFNATQTLDFNTFLNSRLTLTANITTLTCSNIKASQSGTITLVQDATGSRTVPAAWCSQFRWAGGTRGVLSTAANSIDALFYQCVTSSICYVSLSKAQAN